MTTIEIEGISSNQYSFSYEKIYLNNNEAKFKITINFDISFNNTPLLKMNFTSQNIFDNNYNLCEFNY